MDLWVRKMKHDFCIENKNIRLRPLNKSDIESLRNWRNDKTNTTYLSQMPYITKEMQIKWYENYLLREDEIVFAIDETVEFNRLVGSLSLYEIRDEECVFGKILIGDSAVRGHGIGTHATEAAVKFAIEQLGKKRVLLYVYKDNKVAFNLYKNVGFEVADEHMLDNGDIEYTMEYRI